MLGALKGANIKGHDNSNSRIKSEPQAPSGI